jgi:hypothetical protein
MKKHKQFWKKKTAITNTNAHNTSEERTTL